jgi:hypothetical protein
MERHNIIGALKSQQWQKCKGELNAMVALAGSHASTSIHGNNWQELEKAIDHFIEYIEDESLHE